MRRTVLSDELLDVIAEEYLSVKNILIHMHDSPMTFEKFLDMKLKQMEGDVEYV